MPTVAVGVGWHVCAACGMCLIVRGRSLIVNAIVHHAVYCTTTTGRDLSHRTALPGYPYPRCTICRYTAGEQLWMQDLSDDLQTLH
jgi:hypothetical protein